MDDTVMSYMYKETRLNLESAVPGSTVLLRLPSPGASNWSARSPQKRPLTTDIPASEDENTFKQRHLASAASIYYRQYHKSPRNFLWRVLEDGKALAIRAVDLCRQEKISDAPLTLRFTFPSPIRPSCIALADTEDHDVLMVFALLESNHVYILTLRPEFFRRRSSTEDNAGDWCKTYLSSAFGFKHPLKLVALTGNILLVALHDGGLLRLDKQQGADASIWKETFYNEGGWTHGLRSLIPFQSSNTIRHGKINLELSAIASFASSATEIDGKLFTFTVSLDHKIRVWNLADGKIAFIGDLLNQELLPNEMGKYRIHPSQSQLVKVAQDAGGKHLAVTYSPIGAGEFKFWEVLPQSNGTLDLSDLYPDSSLVAPPPTSDVWTLADFAIMYEKNEVDKLALWVLWKNNMTYRVHKVDVQLTISYTANSWDDQWVAVAGEILTDNSTIPVVFSSDPADFSQKWLQFITYPGRFTSTTIETALSIYERGLGGSKNLSGRSTKNIADRICSIVASTATLSRTSDGQMAYEQFRTATDAQWRRFYRLLLELDKQRGEALSLTFDPEQEMAWVVTADGLTAIRDCSAVERLWHNRDGNIPDKAQTVTAVVSAASQFRDSFSDSLNQACNSMLQVELFQDPIFTEGVRLRAFYDKCNFAGQVGNDEYNQLLNNLGGSFRDLTRELYELLIGAMTANEAVDQRLERLPLAEVGRKAVVRGVQETVEIHRSICFDQLVLVAFIDGEVDQEEEGMILETPLVYRQLLVMLKRLELLNWLCKTPICIPVPRAERSSASGIKDKTSSPPKKAEEMRTITVLEGVLGHLLGLVSYSGDTMASLVTEILMRICDPGGEYELQRALIQCFLLTMDRPDLATEFSRFCEQDPFSIYIQGRTSLASKDYYAAANYFKKAAFGLAHPERKKGADRHSSGLLDETEWNLLNAGLPKYYLHIVALFEKDKSYSFVIDFARLALQFASSTFKDVETVNLRTELLSRLFNAAIQTSRYDTAHSSLALFTDQALQHSSLRTLVLRMCESRDASQLISLPFVGLQDNVDEILAQKCQGIINVTEGTPYHKILYAWRMKRNDFRGAATVSLERLQRLQQSGQGDKVFGKGVQPGQDGLETPITKQYLALINALSCVDPKQAWILSEPLPSKGGNKLINEKRKVVTLEDIRRGYQEELDRIAAIDNGQFAFLEGGDEMDIL